MSAFYLGLFYEDPQSGEVKEIENYDRQPIIFSAKFRESGNFPNVVIKNTNHIKIGCSEGNWEIVRVGIFDAKKGGNCLFSSKLTDPIKIDQKNCIVFWPGEFRLILEGEPRGTQENGNL